MYWSFYFLQAAFLHILGDSQWIDHLSGGICRTSDFDRIRAEMVPFFAAGFYRMAGVPVLPLEGNARSVPLGAAIDGSIEPIPA